MKKKILCVILALLMLLTTLPLSVFASEVAKAVEEASPPKVSVSSLYTYKETDPNELRALPDNEGMFYLDVTLNKAPSDNSDVVVYYRTVDDSAVAKWGDYESAEVDAFVTLTKANGYKARVAIESKILNIGFYTDDASGKSNTDKLISRRFLFELISVTDNATLSESNSSLYCYLRATQYFYQKNNAQPYSAFKGKYDYQWKLETNKSQYKAYFPQYEKLKETYEKTIEYFTVFYDVPWLSRPTTPHIQYKGTYTDSFNISFSEEMQSYIKADLADLGVAINGTITREFWDSDGPATFNIYYTYNGERKLALTLNLQGEFDDSTYFGWEQAFEYAIEGREDGTRADHMDENFIGFIIYDNDGNVAHKVEAKGRGELDEIDLCEQLKTALSTGNAVKYSTNLDTEYAWYSTNDPYYYYLRLPSNFAFADSYSYEFISDSTDEDEIRWIENVDVLFALLQNGKPSIAKDEKGNQMVTTNLDTMKQGDPIRMSVRFDRPVHVADPYGNCYITADIYNDKGAILAKDVKFTLTQLGTGDKHYAWDTLVFESEFPDSLDGTKIASLRNIKIVDGTEAKENPTNGIRSFFTESKFINKSLDNVYVNRDFRTPKANVSTKISDSWMKSQSIEICVNVEGSGTTRFNDYVTVYYQWSDSSTDAPESYDSKVVFNANGDNTTTKTIIGTGSGETYLYLKAVSSYGKSSVSGPFGPFKFDNVPPKLTADQIDLSGSLKERVISIPFIDDNGGSGIRDVSLYYIKKNGEPSLLKSFTSDDFKGEPKELTYTISHKDVGVGVDAEGNVLFARDTVEFYWVLTDKLGNSSGKTAEFELTFDTNDYLEGEIKSCAPVDNMVGSEYAQFVENTEVFDEFTFIYNYLPNKNKTYREDTSGRTIIYGLRFELETANLGGEDNGSYDSIVYFNGEEITQNIGFKISSTDSNSYDVWLCGEVLSGRYDIQLRRTEGDSVRVSQIYSVYFTDGYEDSTEVKNKVEFGTLLSNTVYQLSSEYPYFYYKDKDGVVRNVHYNDTKQPATFSSYEKAKEYVYYKELSDIYLVQLTAETANSLNSGTTGDLIAKQEQRVPQAGQYWIRYKSSAWTPTSGESAWVYYYYGESPELVYGALSSILQDALNSVANRIVDYGKTVVLTDTSLFLGSAMGDKMLDKYGMPYLAAGQIHITDEFSQKTMCENVWSSEVGFAADRNIYNGKVSVGEEGTESYREYPIVGNFALSEDSIFQYMTYEQYNGEDKVWQMLNVDKGESFIDVLNASGIYYIREISIDGVSVFAIYIDKSAPNVSFYQTDDNGDFKEVPVDGKEVLSVRTKDLYIGSVSANESDRLSYVAVYKTSNYALVGVYTAQDLASAPIKIEDGNYYIVVSDRSGNHYTITAKVSSTLLECSIKESVDKYIKLTCNRRKDQIRVYEVYLNGKLVTSTYVEEETFTEAGLYTIYVQDIYGNEFSEEYLFERNYPTVTWKYYGADKKYHTYDPNDTNANGFILLKISDNQYKISTAVKTKFSFSGDYKYEFIGATPKYSETVGAETGVEIEAGQSFTLKVYYKNHKDCYTTYSGVVDVTPPSVKVSAEVDILTNGEYALFEEWAQSGKVGDVITMQELYYALSETSSRNVSNGGTVSSDIIKINASDANDLSLIEVYLDGALITKQDSTSGFSQIIVNNWGKYRVVAKDTLGNTSEFTFTNGMPDYFDYFVDGAEKQQELHGYLNFKTVDGKHVYTKLDFGNKSFRLDLKQNADVFTSVGVSGGAEKIYGFRIYDGCIYPLTYEIVLDKNGNKTIDLVAGNAVLNSSAKDFKIGEEYLISKNGDYSIWASIALDKTVSIKINAPEDSSKIVSVSARIEEASGGNVGFVSAELSRKTSDVTLKDLGVQKEDDVRINQGFIVDESTFDSERISSVKLYYSKLNDLDASNLAGRTNIYVTDREYSDEGFYVLVVRNRYGNERVYRISVSKSFGITSSVTFGDGHKIFYSKDYNGTLYSNGEIVLDILGEGVTFTVTKGGAAYNGFVQKKDGEINYLLFSEDGAYEVKLTDSYGNEIARKLEINKSAYTLDEKLLVGYNEKALKRDEGYTNQKLSVDKDVYDKSGIYYLAVQYGDKLNILYDAFSESGVTTDKENLIDVIGSDGDGVYKVICRNRYGAVVTKEIHYRGTPTLHLERTIRSKSESEAYDLSYALSLGFWSNNTLSFSTDAKTYTFTVNGNVTECPKTLVFENAGDFGSFEYKITYIDEYGFEYSFTAYLVRKNVEVNTSAQMVTTDIDGVLNTKKDVFVTFGDNVYATYTRNNGEEVIYHSGDVLKKDGTYRFTVTDYAGNATTLTVKKDTAVEFSFVDSVSGSLIQNGSVVNSSKINFKDLNKDGAYIEKAIYNGVVQNDFSSSNFTEDGKWELIVCDRLGNRAYFSFFIVTHSQNGFAYTTPYEYRITEMWYDNGDGIKVSYMSFINHSDSASSFNFTENGKYTVVMASDVTGMTSTFEFTVNTNAPAVSLVGCGNGETTINDVTITGHKVGDVIRIYRATDTGEELVEEVEVTSLATKIPTVTEGGEYRVVVESEAGVQTELSFVRKHVMNTAGSIFIIVLIAISVIGLFAGLVYRNKSKTDD